MWWLGVALYFILFGGQPGLAQRVEIVRVPRSRAVVGPYLRFDPLPIPVESFRKASTKTVLLRDRQGYLWLKSSPNEKEELIRYDGHYYRAFGGSGLWTSLYYDEVPALREDERGELWAANAKGFGRFDARKEVFVYYRNPHLKEQNVAEMVAGQPGKYWLVYHHYPQPDTLPRPIMAFDTRTKKYQRFLLKKLLNGYTQQSESLKSRKFRPFFQASDGRLWGTMDDQLPSLACFDPATGECVRYPPRGLTAPDLTDAGMGFQNLLIRTLHPDPDGRYLWLGGWYKTGLLRFDTHTLAWKQYYFPEGTYNRTYQITSRNPDQLWLATDAPLLLFDKRTETIMEYPHAPDNPFSQALRMNDFMQEKPSGDLWSSLNSAPNEGTVHAMRPAKQFFRTKDSVLLNRQKAFRVLFQKDGLTYIGYQDENGAVMATYDPKRTTVTELWRHPFDGNLEQALQGAVRDTVSGIDWLYGGTTHDGALFRFDGRRVETVRALIKNAPPSHERLEKLRDIWAVVQDRAGDLWLGDREGLYHDLIRYDHRTREFEALTAGKNGLPNDAINAMMVDRQGTLWIGYRYQGALVRFDPKSRKATVQRPVTDAGNQSIAKIVEDTARQVVWISKYGDGFWKYDQRKNTYQRIDALGEIYGFHLTKKGDLWLKSPNALVCYNPDTEQIRRFGAEYDFTNFTWSAFVKTQDDEFLFGRYQFRPEELQADTVKPKVVFSFVKIFDKVLELPQSLNHTEALELQHDQNFFSVGFSVLSFFQQDKNQFAYILDGFSPDWIPTSGSPVAAFTNVPPGRYTLKIRGSNSDDIWSDERHLAIVIHPAFWQTAWFKVMLALLLLGSVYALYRYQLAQKTLRSRLRSEVALRRQQEAEFQKYLAQAEISALRAQMNPHFIFNCLNSIQYFTANNDATKASDYLTKFSRLIRLVLENSRSEKVTLENELETLRLYIEMEVMRFGGKVSYHIEVAEGIAQDYLEIPPLLLQPFVENAIWHGLMHKEAGGTVKVSITQPNERLLKVEITDNGIGRQRAAEFKSKSATRNKSFGMKVTAERIQLINQLYQTQASVDIQDLTDEAGRASGTRVVVKIPL